MKREREILVPLSWHGPCNISGTFKVLYRDDADPEILNVAAVNRDHAFLEHAVSRSWLIAEIKCRHCGCPNA